MKTTKTPDLESIRRIELSYRIQLYLTAENISLKDAAKLACIKESLMNDALKQQPISRSALLSLCRILEIDETELSEPPYDEKLFYRLMRIMNGHTDEEIKNLWTELRATYPHNEIERDKQWLRYVFGNTKSKITDPNEKLAIDQMCVELLGVDPSSLLAGRNLVNQKQYPLVCMMASLISEIDSKEVYDEIEKEFKKAREKWQ